jgi:hypothetical protein
MRAALVETKHGRSIFGLLTVSQWQAMEIMSSNGDYVAGFPVGIFSGRED